MIVASIMFARTVAVLAMPGLALAQTGLVGRVTSDSGGQHPLIGVTVAIPSLHKSARTDSAGLYGFDGLALGHYTVTVRALGYQPKTDTLSITNADGAVHDFIMPVLAQPLDTIVSTSANRGPLSPAMRGFEERRKAGFGHFIGEDALRKNDHEKLTDIARRLPGAKLVRSGSQTNLASTRKSGPSAMSSRPCYSSVYVDGIEIYNQAAIGRARGGVFPPPNLDDFNISDIGAIEFYGGDATAPPGFRQTGCGLLLIWSREH